MSLKKIMTQTEKKYSEKVNQFFILFGGINKTFKLKTKEVTFAILQPSKYNINFYIFSKLKKYVIFKFFFKLLLRIPYFFIETFFGSLLMSIVIIWAAIGREPITVVFCFSLMTEFWVFLFFTGMSAARALFN